MSKSTQSTEGKRIYVESLMSAEEYKECARKYPNCYNSSERPVFFNSEFKWRYKMGAQMTDEEIRVHNTRLTGLGKAIKKSKEKNNEQ